jgi:sugar lactone lactonase YvrE
VRHQSDGLHSHTVGSGQDTLLVSNAADQADAYYLAWAPDGRKLYYLTRSARGWTVRVAGAPGKASSILVDFDDPTRPQTKYGFCTDGKMFYFTIGSPESDIFVVDMVRR